VRPKGPWLGENVRRRGPVEDDPGGGGLCVEGSILRHGEGKGGEGGPPSR
jgi:hypothetical protein